MRNVFKKTMKFIIITNLDMTKPASSVEIDKKIVSTCKY